MFCGGIGYALPPQNPSCDTPVEIFEDNVKNADIVLVGFEIEARLFPGQQGKLSDYVRVFRIVQNLRGKIPENALLFYSDQKHEGWGNETMFVHENYVLSRRASGRIFYIFFEYGKCRKVRENEFKTVNLDGPFVANPQPVGGAFVSAKDMHEILKISFPEKSRISKCGPETAFEKQLRERATGSDIVLRACIINECLTPCRREDDIGWDTEIVFRVTESISGEIPVNAILRSSGFPRKIPDRYP